VSVDAAIGAATEPETAPDVAPIAAPVAASIEDIGALCDPLPMTARTGPAGGAPVPRDRPQGAPRTERV